MLFVQCPCPSFLPLKYSLLLFIQFCLHLLHFSHLCGSLAGLDLVQRAGGFKYAHKHSSWSGGHQLCEVRVSTYTDTPRNAFWTLEDVDAFLSIRKDYPTELLKSLEQKRPGITAVLSANYLGWTDEHMVSARENRTQFKMMPLVGKSGLTGPRYRAFARYYYGHI